MKEERSLGRGTNRQEGRGTLTGKSSRVDARTTSVKFPFEDSINLQSSRLRLFAFLLHLPLLHFLIPPRSRATRCASFSLSPTANLPRVNQLYHQPTRKNGHPPTPNNHPLKQTPQIHRRLRHTHTARFNRNPHRPRQHPHPIPRCLDRSRDGCTCVCAGGAGGCGKVGTGCGGSEGAGEGFGWDGFR